MRILVWLFRAAIFFALFAFALNNQQTATRELVLRPMSGRRRMVFIVLAAFALRLRLRRAGDGAELVAPPPRRAPPRPSRRPPPRRPPRARRAAGSRRHRGSRWTLTSSGCCSACRWSSSSAGSARASTCASCKRETARVAEGLLQGPEPAAQRTAGQGHRRLHRGRPERPRHAPTALRARQPVPPPRRVRARGARAPAPARPRRPAAAPSASARSTRWRRTS